MKIDIDKAFEKWHRIHDYFEYMLDYSETNVGNRPINSTDVYSNSEEAFKAAFDLLIPIIEKLEKSNEFYKKTESWEAESDGDGYTWSYFIEGIIENSDIEDFGKESIKYGGKLARQTQKEVNEIIEKINNGT